MSRSMTTRSKELITSLPSYLVEAHDGGHSTKRAKANTVAASDKKDGNSDTQLQKREMGSLALATGQYKHVPKRKKLVLEEDKYTSALEKIIQRDFFPDLPMLKAQAEYLDALEANDLDRMRDIKLRFQTPAPSAAATTGTARSQHQKRGTQRKSAQQQQQPQRQGGAEPFNTPLTTPLTTPQPRPQKEDDVADVGTGADTATHTTGGGQARSSNFEDSSAGSTRAAAVGPDVTPDVGQARAGGSVKGDHPQAHAAGSSHSHSNSSNGNSSHSNSNSSNGGGDKLGEEPGAEDDKPMDTALSLNQFLNKYTSEDNASFEKIIEDTSARMEKQYRKYFGEVSAKSKLALAAAENDKPLSVGYEIDTWRYVPRNALMYGPQSQVLSAADLIRMSDERRTRINHANTRFTRDPYAGRTSTGGAHTRTRATLGPSTGSGASGQGVVDLAKQSQGTEDGSGTPMVNGYKLVATPSPVPGRDMDPLMTWGEIEGTPFRLDAGDSVHATPGPVFNIPPLPEREQMARKLADKATKKRRPGGSTSAAPPSASSTAASVGARSRSRSRSPWGGTPTTSKATQQLRSMTPAAQRLAQNLWGRESPAGSSSTLNRALRTTTPKSRVATGGSAGGRVGRSTPLVTPVATPQTTPRRIGGRVKTPVIEQRGGESAAVSAAAVVGKGDAQESKTGTGGLTDNLL